MEHGSVVRACAADPDLPAASTVYAWLGTADDRAVNEEVRARLRETVQLAREAKADALFDEWEDVARDALAAPDKDMAACIREFGVMAARKAAALSPDRYSIRRQSEGDGRSADVAVAVQVVLPPKHGGD